MKIAIYNFGTRVFTLQYLHLSSWDSLKIDPYFIENFYTNETNAVITQGLIEISYGLGLRVMAKGIENSSELAVLK